MIKKEKRRNLRKKGTKEVKKDSTVLFDLHKITKNKKSDDFDYGQE